MKLKIGAAAKALGISPKTIRFYEEVGLIPPPRREGSGWFAAGRRVYDENELERLEFVKEARQLDFAIQDIKELLANYENGPPCGCSARPYLRTLIERKLEAIDQTARKLASLRDELHSLLARTVALEKKTPGELMKLGVPSVSAAVFGSIEQADDEKKDLICKISLDPPVAGRCRMGFGGAFSADITHSLALCARQLHGGE